MDYRKSHLRRLSVLFMVLLLGTGIGSAWVAAQPAETVPTETLSGWFGTIWVDDFEHPENSTVRHFITDDAGQEIELDVSGDLLGRHGGIRGLSGRRVNATVEAPASPPSVQKRKVLSIELEAQPAPLSSGTAESMAGNDGSGSVAVATAAVTGSKSYATLLCKFSDTGKDPAKVSFFNGLMGASYPGMDHFWREVSYNTIDLTGSTVYGWYTLPRTFAEYNAMPNKLAQLVSDCTAAADPDVYFPFFYGINMMYGGPRIADNGGAGYVLTLDGVTKSYGVTQISDWNEQKVVAHEMGHSFGLPHSGQPLDPIPVDSMYWDVMYNGGIPTFTHGQYGPLADHTISYHKDRLGWIPSGQKYTPAPFTTQTINLERLALPTDGGTAYRMAQIPIDSTHFYTVEARRFAGYDDGIPREGVIIFTVDTVPGERNAVVIDGDADGDANDEGAAWTVGETFEDAANGITVRVDADTGTGYMVTITRAIAGTSVITNPATDVTDNSATLNGTVNPNGQPTTAWFEWGITVGYGNATPAQDVGSGTTDVPISAAITGLSPSVTYHFRAVAQTASGTVYGSDLTFFTISGSDLIVTDLSGPAQAAIGTTISATLTVKNQGTQGAAFFRNGIYLSDRTDLTGWNILLDYQGVPGGLAAGASYTDTFTHLTIPGSARTGNLYLVALADQAKVVNETDETNNTMARPIEITVPDLVVNSVSGPTDAPQSSVVSGSVQVQNLGNAATPTGFNVGIFLSTDTTVTGGDILLGTVSASALGVGASQAIPFSLQLPGVRSGNYFFGAIADYPSAVVESNEGNNAKAGNKIRIR